MLSLATSLDALAVGIGFSLMQGNILTASLIIALVSFLLSLTGGFLGKTLGTAFGKKMEIIGGRDPHLHRSAHPHLPPFITLRSS